MPGDGSCLFHSLVYGLGEGEARQLRREIAKYIVRNQDLEIAESPLSDWISWAGHRSVAAYADQIARGAWGGGIEMAVCSRLKKVNVHVFEKGGGFWNRGGFKRISCFDVPGARKTITVLYGGRVHYDYLTVTKKKQKKVSRSNSGFLGLW